MQKAISIALLTCLLIAGCGQKPELTDNQIVEKIWQGYVEDPNNARSGFSWLEVNGQLLKKGTVSSSAITDSAKGRLPAYMACYDFVSVMGTLSEEPNNVCIYYVDNPQHNSHSLIWRGKGYTGQLEAKMRADGFTDS